MILYITNHKHVNGSYHPSVSLRPAISRVLVRRTRHVTPVVRLWPTVSVTMATSTSSYPSSTSATSEAPSSFSRISAKSANLSDTEIHIFRIDFVLPES